MWQFFLPVGSKGGQIPIGFEFVECVLQCFGAKRKLTSEKTTYLVTGATGSWGPRVVQGLQEAGGRVRILSLEVPSTDGLPKGVEVRVCDITDRPAVESAMQGVDVVIHLAALLHAVDPSWELRGDYERVNVEGTATVVQEALRAGVKRLVFSSTIAVYGSNGGQVLTENSPPYPETLYARTKLAAERIVLEAKRLGGEPFGVVLRLGAVYGSRVKGNYRRLLCSLARGRFIPVGQGLNSRTLIYERDAARAVALAAKHPMAAGRIYNVSDGRLHTLRQIIATICEALGRTPPRMALPLGPVRLVAGMFEGTAKLLGYRSPIGKAMVAKYTEDIAVSSERIQMDLGFAPKFDLATGWRETIQEMRQAQAL